MEITVNQQHRTIPENYSVEQLLASLMPDMQKGIAVAVNQTIVPKSEWQVYKLQANDKVMLIKATQGG
ncbi:sulfur carrier protein ThiS [Pedobacter sp. SYSU D00535]|uniref:sulfur carrier protein ThiS n=1 Tax=Pedobacter sp. SYSU D00535 TaxID=2810308 RepID=UPI001A9656AD|nr:sulfur carrier protein ThiS [Pedobacter sp. SYSU D00535]